jgi:hypothetical protein
MKAHIAVPAIHTGELAHIGRLVQVYLFVEFAQVQLFAEPPVQVLDYRRP